MYISFVIFLKLFACIRQMDLHNDMYKNIKNLYFDKYNKSHNSQTQFTNQSIIACNFGNWNIVMHKQEVLA